MIYFDNAATGGIKPESVLKSTKSLITQINANVGRSGHRLSVLGAQKVYDCRQTLADFFGAENPEKVIFTKNCSEALNIAILGIAEKGDHFITTELEHNSVIRPLEHLQKESIISYDVAKINVSGEVSTQSILELIKPNTKAVVCTLASNVTAKSVDLNELSKKLPNNIFLICDSAQASGHIPINMKLNRIDALAVAGHKGMNAFQGSGILLLSQRFNPKPLMYGGTGSESFNLDMPSFYPDRLESGTLNYFSIVSLYEGTLYAQIKMQSDGEFVYELTKKIHNSLSDKRITFFSKPNKCGICSFLFDDMQSEEIATKLSNDYDIAVRGGLHCAPLTHKALNTFEKGGLLRVSLSPFNTVKEVDSFIYAIKTIIKGI